MPPKTTPAQNRILKLADFDDRRLLLEEFAAKRGVKPDLVGTSNVVALAEHVGSFASIEVDELSALTPVDQRIAVMALLRGYLAMEFGQLRITQSNRAFIIQHRGLDELISALLRVQYHLYQCTAEDLEAVGIPATFVSMNLTWGAGNSVTKADAERLKRRRGKRFTQDR